MFDLEATLDQWRRATWRGEAAALAELEDHLRQEFATLTSAGHSAPEAWQLATAKLGEPADLGREFAKINGLEHVDRVAIGGLVVAVAITLITLCALLARHWSDVADRPLLTMHVITITLGYVAGLFAAATACYVTVRIWLARRSAANLEFAAVSFVGGASAVAAMSSAIGFVLGAVWAKLEWGRAFTAMPVEIGGIVVIAVFGIVAVAAFKAVSARVVLSMAVAGGGAVLAAWFGAVAMQNDYPAWFTVVGFGGLAVSLAMAAMSLAAPRGWRDA
ncbi:MAG: hypothetical protein H0T51_25995 [Pirellulales bacterium]|nr:hypothetical protein [Pirellulales bacterium]